jgi:nicotinate-nucleotide pyrophosphorylase (carboxylating)
MPDYRTVIADRQLEDDLRQLVRLSIFEELRREIDWTTVCLIDADARGECCVTPREEGICAGLVTLPWIVDEFDCELDTDTFCNDGDRLEPGKPIARLAGNARDLLTSERTILNILCRLCGVATLTERYVREIASTGVRLYDTRKTTPGWRMLEKYAVHCGGGRNHRTGLFDGFLIKDNHLALGGEGGRAMSPREAAKKAIAWRSSTTDEMTAPSIVEIEVDSLDQLREVLPVGPDIVLADNFSVDQLIEAVRIRDEIDPAVELEASGNVTIATIAAIAATGVDRISSGALTHQATWLDLGMDWTDPRAGRSG